MSADEVFGSFFLHNPELLPHRVAGEPWGDCEVSVAMAGGPYVLTGLSQEQANGVATRFAKRAENVVSPLEIKVFRVSRKEFRDFSTRGWHYSIDFDHQPSRVRMAGRQFFGIIDLDRRADSSGFRIRSVALWTCCERDLVDWALLENFLRVLVSYRMLSLGGVMLHSAAVARNGRAHVFVGHSGAGKSTVSSLSMDQGFQVLSDDINTLTPGASGVEVEQVPFAGDFGHERLVEGCFPLAGLYRLEQASSHELTVLSAAETLGLLLGNSPFVNTDEHRMDLLVKTLTELAASTTAQRLCFRRDADFWGLLPP